MQDLNKRVPDEVVVKNRIARYRSRPKISLPADALLNFIQRRELNRNGKGPIDSGLLWCSLYGPSKSSLFISRYENNEVRIGFRPTSNPSPPPPNFGERSSLGLTRYARRRICSGVNYLTRCTSKGHLALITLSYSDDALPDNHRTCKKQLNTFFKALKRYQPKAKYVWVAEIQPQRLKTSGVSAIHFHIACTHFVSVKETATKKEWLRRTWRRITKCDKSRPNQIRVLKPNRYMSKYMAKDSHIDEGEFLISWQQLEGKWTRVKKPNPDFHWIGGDRYGMCHKTSQGIKPVETKLIACDYLDFSAIMHDMCQNSGVLNAEGQCPIQVNWTSDYVLSINYSSQRPTTDVLKLL